MIASDNSKGGNMAAPEIFRKFKAMHARLEALEERMGR